jgi:hypothetical protein
MEVTRVHPVLIAYLRIVSHHVSIGCKESIWECVCHVLWVPYHSPESLIIRSTIETMHMSSFNLVKTFLKYHSVSHCINVVKIIIYVNWFINLIVLTGETKIGQTILLKPIRKKNVKLSL